MDKENGVKRDIGFAALGVVVFYVILVLANVVDTWLGLDAAYNLVSVASAFLKVVVSSAFTWVLMRIAFKNTLGSDFGTTLDTGWKNMTPIEKTRWMVGTFVAVFLAIILAS